MFKLFNKIKCFNATFFIITHNNKLSKTRDRIIQIEDGNYLINMIVLQNGLILQ